MPPSITVSVSSTEVAAREDRLLGGDREVGVVGASVMPCRFSSSAFASW